MIPVTRPYKLVSREVQPEDTIVRVGDIEIGNGHLTMIAGPCAIESLEQALTIARHVQRSGAIFSGAVPLNPAHPPTPSRGWGWKDLKFWLLSARKPACRW